MLMLQLVAWWYGQGWLQVIHDFPERLVRVSHVFSLPILLRTLWAPWRRIVTYPGAGIDAKIRALADNLVSRCIGFTVRILVLIAAMLILLLTMVWGLVYIVIWPLIPLVIPAAFVKGIFG
jgi:hypothetical protein